MTSNINWDELEARSKAESAENVERVKVMRSNLVALLGPGPYAPDVEELLDDLEGVVQQSCSGEAADDGESDVFDSGAISAYRDGMLTLARYGRCEIEWCVGRRVFARFKRRPL